MNLWSESNPNFIFVFCSPFIQISYCSHIHWCISVLSLIYMLLYTGLYYLLFFSGSPYSTSESSSAFLYISVFYNGVRYCSLVMRSYILYFQFSALPLTDLSPTVSIFWMCGLYVFLIILLLLMCSEYDLWTASVHIPCARVYVCVCVCVCVQLHWAEFHSAIVKPVALFSFTDIRERHFCHL